MVEFRLVFLFAYHGFVEEISLQLSPPQTKEKKQRRDQVKLLELDEQMKLLGQALDIQLKD